MTHENIQNWNFASSDWSCPVAENNFVVGERFSCRMEAKDVVVVETFEAENENPVELQKQGWLSILNKFKKYAEAK